MAIEVKVQIVSVNVAFVISGLWVLETTAARLLLGKIKARVCADP
jgi:hypothetical protein